MQQRLVAWGDIGTDHKALIAIEFNATEHKVYFHALPEEEVTKEIQHRVFTIWKNGGEFEFPDRTTAWEADAEHEKVLPENVRLHKPELLVNAQRQWNKKLELENNFTVLGEKLHLLELELDGLKEFNQDLWNKAKSLWDDILVQKKDGHLAWSQADELKIRINSVFDGLKAFRRLNKEKNFDESNALLKVFQKQITDCEERLIYPDEWNKIFQNLKDIQGQMKDAPLLYKHRRKLMNMINGVFSDMRKYRQADQINHLEDRIQGLERVLRGLHQAIERDESSYKNQFEKMKHYTRGKMSDEDIESQLKYIKDQGKVKRKKIKSIEKTIRNLDNRLDRLKNPPKPEPKPEPKTKKTTPPAEPKAKKTAEEPASKKEKADAGTADEPKAEAAEIAKAETPAEAAATPSAEVPAMAADKKPPKKEAVSKKSGEKAKSEIAAEAEPETKPEIEEEAPAEEAAVEKVAKEEAVVAETETAPEPELAEVAVEVESEAPAEEAPAVEEAAEVEAVAETEVEEAVKEEAVAAETEVETIAEAEVETPAEDTSIEEEAVEAEAVVAEKETEPETELPEVSAEAETGAPAEEVPEAEKTAENTADAESDDKAEEGKTAKKPKSKARKKVSSDS